MIEMELPCPEPDCDEVFTGADANIAVVNHVSAAHRGAVRRTPRPAVEPTTRDQLIKRAAGVIHAARYTREGVTTAVDVFIATGLAEAGLLADPTVPYQVGLLVLANRRLTAERDALQARIGAALALMDYWDEHGGSIPQGHRLRAALQGPEDK